MFAPFRQVSRDSKPVKIEGKGSVFSTDEDWNRPLKVTFEPLPTDQNWNGTLEVTFELISIANKNLITKTWFCFFNFVFQLGVDCLDH